jgi:hypothetical protein
MEESPQLFPDGRWLAYSSNEPGRIEVFVLRVQPLYPDPQANQIHVVQNWFEELRRRVPASRVSRLKGASPESRLVVSASPISGAWAAIGAARAHPHGAALEGP